MTKMIAAALLLWSSMSFADVSGKWTGWGDWTYEGSGTHCDTMTMGFVETATKLTRTGGYFDCQVVGLDVSPGEWVKQGNNLIDDGKVVGTITDKTVHLVEQYSDTVKIISDISIEAGHFDYSETWYDKDDVVIYEITGRLFKRQ